MAVFRRNKVAKAFSGLVRRMAKTAGGASLSITRRQVDRNQQARLDARRRANSFIVALQRWHVLPKNLQGLSLEMNSLVAALQNGNKKRIAFAVRQIQSRRSAGLELLSPGTLFERQAISYGLDAAKRRRSSASAVLQDRREIQKLREQAGERGYALVKRGK